MKAKREETEIQVRMSDTQMKDFYRLAKKLNMSVSSLGAMMIVDTTNSHATQALEIQKELRKEHWEEIKENSPYNKSNKVSIRMDKAYVKQLKDTLKQSENYKYYLQAYAAKCIEHQMQEFQSGVLATPNGKQENSLDDYIDKKVLWSGVPRTQMQKYYLGKQVSKIISETSSEMDIWNMSAKELFEKLFHTCP